jgi:NAD(P)-dependent dehydrogenase (short-subunit alcohol dehydrogenase family)/putative sterol carrier protein
MGLFDGKVVIATGAGGGIGRAHALAFASEGGRVVVNDLGTSRHGSGVSHNLADAVVEEIRGAGCEAVASYDDVSTAQGGAAIIQTAIDQFGQVDVLVNNAGIIRDKSFKNMDEAMWDLVMQVHTKQLFALCQPFVRHLLARGVGGTIVNTSSLAGLLGNFGQANYATAKAGVAGFTRTLALEGRKDGIRVNAVAPVAKTRMTEELAMVPSDMTPEKVTPMVLYLASELSQGVTGRVFGVHGNQIFEYKMTQTDGVTKPGEGLWGVREIAEQFAAITATGVSAAPGLAGDDRVGRAFAQIPQGYRGDTRWEAVLHWVIAGGSDQTLTMTGGTCTHSGGLVGSPTCTVKTDKDTVVGVFSGALDPTQAFMAGKIAADNLPDMMKMGAAFDFEAIGSAIARTMGDEAP